MNRMPRAVTSLERRVTAVLCVRQAFVWLSAWAIVFGVIALVARFVLAGSPPPLAFFAALPLIAVAAALHAHRMRPSRDSLIAFLDADVNCGGLLMASTAVPLGEWSVSVDRIPRVRWTNKRHVVVALLAIAFAAAAMLVPARAAQSKNTLDIRRDADQLQKRIDLLREEQVLTDARAESMTKTVEALQRDAEAEDPAKAWEALDSIAEATAQAAKEAGDEALRKGEQLTRAEAMAQGLASDAIDPSQVAAGMREMSNELQSAQNEAKELLANLPADLRDAIAKNTLTKEQLEKLAGAAGNQKEKLHAMLNKLRDAGLIDPKVLRQFENGTNPGDRSELAQFLKQHGSETKFSTAIGQWCQGKPGRDRGRGDAPMFFGEQAREDGAFKEQTLPPAAAAALSGSQLVAVSAATPQTKDAQRSTGGALATTQPGSGSAFTTVVLPRHRGTVERFFERKP
jgi:hypothetical protein